MLLSQDWQWILENCQFIDNPALRSKILHTKRDHWTVIADEIMVIKVNQDLHWTIQERYPLQLSSQENVTSLPIGKVLGFHTDEQYFTDPKKKKILFSEQGFIFYSEGQSIYALNRQTKEVFETSFAEINTTDGSLWIEEGRPILKLGPIHCWVSSQSEMEKAKQARLKGSGDALCPICQQGSLNTQSSGPVICSECKTVLHPKPIGWSLP